VISLASKLIVLTVAPMLATITRCGSL